MNLPSFSFKKFLPQQATTWETSVTINRKRIDYTWHERRRAIMAKRKKRAGGGK